MDSFPEIRQKTLLSVSEVWTVFQSCDAYIKAFFSDQNDIGKLKLAARIGNANWGEEVEVT